jgi:peptide/nickel transport system substrate-binding protein
MTSGTRPRLVYRRTPQRDDPVAGDRRTLRFFGPGDPDHLDPASVYFARSGQVMRALTRQLFSYPALEDIAAPLELFTPVPDVAMAVPSEANGGVDEHRRAHTIRLRRGVQWDTPAPREVTAHDFVRGFKRIAHAPAGSDARRYFTDTILGMRAYCEAFDEMCPGRAPDSGEPARFQVAHEIEGVRAADDRTLVITLVEPANDLLNILATGFASAAPVEYDGLSDTPESSGTVISCGPYRVASRRREIRQLVLERNPAWTQQADPIRHQFADAIHLQAPDAGGAGTSAQIEAGEIDLAWPFTVVSWRDAASPARAFERFSGFTLNPYLVFNLRSPNAGGAMRSLKVRQAIAYAIDKAAIGRIFDRLRGVKTMPLHSVIVPGSVGHRDFMLYPTPDDRGDPVTARALLADAGYGAGLELRAAVRDVGLHVEVMRAVASDLMACGITLTFAICDPAEYYASVLGDPAAASAGLWDIAEPGWTPDWYGNNGRAIVEPLFQTDRGASTANYGGYSNPDVDRLISRALRESDPVRAESDWHEADLRIMRDLPVVPLLAFACQSCAARTWATTPVTWWPRQ